VLVNQLERAAGTYPALTTSIRGYDGADTLPASLQGWARTEPRTGLYEFTAEELHVAVIPADGEQGRAFVVFDVAGIEAASSEDWWWLLAIIGAVATLGALGFALGTLVMGRALAPVAHLAEVVSGIDVEHLSTGDHRRIEASRFGDDEVGVLAGTIEKTLERIDEFVARERYFTSSASHELRTPITVMTGALELLEQSDLAEDDVKLVDRMRRATHDMRTVTEMFLCLSREVDDGLYDELFPVLPLVTRAIEQHRHLLSGKDVAVGIDELARPSVRGHPQAFSIAVSNLVRNAFERTLDGQGPITIAIGEHELSVTNRSDGDTDGPHTPPASAAFQGYGLGLGIVQRLCERNGWTFSLSAEDSRVVARLSW
jgi:signal transduction histidine kinase